MPTRHQVRTGPFILFSNFPIKDDPPAVRCLQALERDLKQHLDFEPRPDDDPVEIYVLDDRNAFTHFLKFYYPELPPRRAFFLAQGNQRVVYTYVEPAARGRPATRGDPRPAPRRRSATCRSGSTRGSPNTSSRPDQPGR